jgi:transposase
MRDGVCGSEKSVHRVDCIIAKWSGKEVHLISREANSKQCSSCHKIYDMVFKGELVLVLARDENAAINGESRKCGAAKQPVNRASKSLLTCAAVKRASQSL